MDSVQGCDLTPLFGDLSQMEITFGGWATFRITFFKLFFSTDTLANVEENWIKEVRHYCRKVPIILVGNKIDIRTDPQVMKELASNNKVSKDSTYTA